MRKTTRGRENTMKRFLIIATTVMLTAFSVPAFAAINPFMDVPANHWAYDAVLQLAARGVISGYPDSAYKGAQPATRYEMASAIARSLAKADIEKASEKDIETLKRLIVEFRDELDALGIKFDDLDERLGVFERDLGGWSLSGVMAFDVDLGADASKGFYTQPDGPRNWIGENEFDLNTYGIYFRKRIDENASFEAFLYTLARGADGVAKAQFSKYRVTARLPYDVIMNVGRMQFDGERDLGFQMGFDGEDDSVFGNFFLDGFWFKKSWGMANLQLLISRINDSAGSPKDGNFGLNFEKNSGLEQFYTMALADFQINERLRVGILSYYLWPDEEIQNVNGSGFESDSDILTIGGYASYSFVPGVALKGIYYHQDQGESYEREGETTASLWRVILDINQDALKFTSLRLEYGKWDNNFIRFGHGFSFTGADLMANTPPDAGTGTVWGIRAEQRWNDKWRTLQRYFSADFGSPGYDDTATYTFSVTYQMTPAISFELAYDAIDYGTGNPNSARNGDDGIVRLRTLVFL
jgi:hypothetical protein